MSSTDLSPIADFSKLRPHHVTDAINNAQKFGLSDQQAEQLHSAIAHLLAEFEKREGRFADNTVKQLKSNWARFELWCQQNGHGPLPASIETVETFFQEHADKIHRNSIKSYCWSISKIHRITGCPDPLNDEMTKDSLGALYRQKLIRGESSVQASAFREHHLDKLTQLWRHSSSLILRRNLAILTVAYETMLRASELANIRFSHLEYSGDGTAVLTIPITKANHSGDPDTCLLSEEAVEIIEEYLEMAKLERSLPDAFLFAGITKHNTAMKQKKRLIRPAKWLKNQQGRWDYRKISTQTIEVVFNQAWQTLNLHRVGIAPFTAHSARVGACQDLLEDGYSILQVQQSGRWSTPAMVLRYGRGILAKDSAMARKRVKRST